MTLCDLLVSDVVANHFFVPAVETNPPRPKLLPNEIPFLMHPHQIAAAHGTWVSPMDFRKCQASTLSMVMPGVFLVD